MPLFSIDGRPLPLLRGGPLLAAAIILAAAGCGPALPSLNSPGGVLPVTAVRAVETKNALKTVVSYGRLKPSREAQLTFARGGQVASVLQRLGETAAQGEKLATLEQADLESQRQTVEKSVQQRQEQIDSPTTPAAERAALQQSLAAAQRQLAEINAELERGTIVAPFDCVLAEQHYDVGASVSAAMPLLRVLATGAPVVEAVVSTEEGRLNCG